VTHHLFSTAVEKLWMKRAFPVKSAARKNFRAHRAISSRARERGFLRFACFEKCDAYNSHTSQQPHRRRLQPLTTLVHRFQESIAGRAYLIEVAAVDPDRWRACIVKAPGVPTALMPFYGPTPDHAAGLLRAWLTRAHAGAAGSARR
jgi:hypothetical protein